MREKIAVLGANEPLIPFYRQARNLGYEIIGFAWSEGAVCNSFCDKFYPVSFADKEKILELCREEKVSGITSFSLESALPTVIYVARNMGLISNTEECLARTQSKFAQRCELERAGIAVPKYYRIENEQDISKVECGFPVIVKPIDSGGSQGISKVDCRDKLPEAFRYSAKCSHSGQVIVEEYIDGREFSIECISHQGKHHFLQITDKVTSGAPRFVELQHHQPANISPKIHESIRSMVEKALDALLIENSPSHTEIKLNSSGHLYIIETGARMGGDYISSDLVRLSTGYDFVEGAIKLALNQFETPMIKRQMYSGVFFYSKLAPEVGEIIRHSERWPEIVEAGYYSNMLLTEVKSNADRAGYVLYQSSNGRMDFFSRV